MKLSKENESQSTENLKQKAWAEKEARRLTKRFGVKWGAKWSLYFLGEERTPFWQWNPECVEDEEKFKLHPPLQISARAKAFMAEVLVVVSRGWNYALNGGSDGLRVEDSSFDAANNAILELVLKLLGLPAQKNPSGDEGYRGPRDFCYDRWYDMIAEVWDSKTPDERFQKAMEIVETSLEYSTYRDEQEDAALEEIYFPYGKEDSADCTK